MLSPPCGSRGAVCGDLSALFVRLFLLRGPAGRIAVMIGCIYENSSQRTHHADAPLDHDRRLRGLLVDAAYAGASPNGTPACVGAYAGASAARVALSEPVDLVA